MEEIESLYEDMETPGGNLYIPNRVVPVYRRRTISQNTHYMLTQAEAKLLIDDPRVIAVELAELIYAGRKLAAATVLPTATRTSSGYTSDTVLEWQRNFYNWDDRVFTKGKDTDDFSFGWVNWGIYRCLAGNQVNNWGSNGSLTGPGGIRGKEVYGVTRYTLTGKNVDFISYDGVTSAPNHPEFAVNKDGTGGSRFNQYNWYLLNSLVNSIVTGKAESVYINGGIFNETTFFSTASTRRAFVAAYARGTYRNVPVYMTYYNIGGTLYAASTGTGATFDITIASGPTAYSDCITDLIVKTNGQGYESNMVLAIRGSHIGGVDGYDDLLLQITDMLLQQNYSYAGNPDPDASKHGTHTASTVAGNRQGWAVDANIYQFDFLDQLIGNFGWDYIRAFHRTKQINPLTGRKNPTIVNASIGNNLIFPAPEIFEFYANFSLGSPVGGKYRGTLTGSSSNPNATPLTLAQWKALGLYVAYPNIVTWFGTYNFMVVPQSSISEDADVRAAINEGIIVVAAAGNESFYSDLPSGPDFNNEFYATYTPKGGAAQLLPWKYHQGSSPGVATGVICVGAIDITVTEKKGYYSNTGPRINIYAPGTHIVGAYDRGTLTDGEGIFLWDFRDTRYYIGKETGTSMAAPQVCGVLACALERYPSMTPAQALDYLNYYAKTGQISDSGGTMPTRTSDTMSLQGGPNKYLFFPEELPYTNLVWPRINHWIPPAPTVTKPGVRTYPRNNIKRTK